MDDLLTDFPTSSGERRPAVWLDKTGTTHRAVGADVHRDVRLLWTACGAMDVPANAAWIQRPEDTVDCPKCLEAAP